MEAKLKALIDSGITGNNTLMGVDDAKKVLGLIDALRAIQSLPSVRMDEGSQIAFFALKKIK